jgi:glycosyltransferase involved in cell wall biosynthesis
VTAFFHGRPLAVSAGLLGSGGMSGLQRYIEGVLDPLLRAEPHAVVFGGADEASRRWPAQARRVRVPGFARATTRGNLMRALWYQSALPARLRRMGAGAFYAPLPEGMLRPPCPQVVTVHDLIPLRYPASAPRQAHYYRHVLPRILRACRAVVAVSRATADDLREWYGLEVPIHVVHQGYRSDLFRPARPGEAPAPAAARLGDYLLTVAEGRAYKNLDRLVRAFARAELRDVRLVLVGRLGPDAAGLRALPERLGVADRVSFLGAVPDAELAALYRGALGFVFPSLWEGFGIPPLEAMASGCPVAASNAASIPEVCGPAALYFDPERTDDVARAICTLAGDEALRARLARRGLERAREFSFERCAAGVREALGIAAGEGVHAAPPSLRAPFARGRARAS